MRIYPWSLMTFRKQNEKRKITMLFAADLTAPFGDFSLRNAIDTFLRSYRQLISWLILSLTLCKKSLGLIPDTRNNNSAKLTLSINNIIF